MIRINMIRQDERHPDRGKRHPPRASCEISGRRFEADGPAPIYKLLTLLWLRDHGGEEFEVWDDRDPFGKPGGLALHGRVRNWARLVNWKVTFDRQAESAVDFAPDEVDLIARAAGRVSDAAEIDSPAPGNVRTAPISLTDGPDYPQKEDGPYTRVSGARTPEAA